MLVFALAASTPADAAKHKAAAPTGEVRLSGAKAGDGKDDTAALLQALDKCKQTGAKRLVFPKGRYDFFAGSNPGNAGTLFILDGIRGLTIDGGGSELTFHGMTGAFYIANSQGVRFVNMTLDWDAGAQSVGTVVATAEKSFDVRVLDEFPVKGGEPVEAFMDFDPKTRLPMKGGVDSYYNTESTELIAPQTLRVKVRNPVEMKVGVLAVLRHKVYGPSAFVFDRSRDCGISDVTIYGVPGMGCIGNVCMNMTLERFRVRLKPRTSRLVSASADATHFGGCKGTISIRDCLFEGMGDDAVNIKSGLYLSVREKVDDRTVLCQHNLKMANLPDPGDRMEMSHVEDLIPYASGEVESAEMAEGENVHRVRFKSALPADLKVGDVLGNASRVPSVRISKVSVRNNRARGFLIQTRDAIIENCKFENCTGGGVWVMTEVVHFFESIGTRDVVVRNNTFKNCNYGAARGEGVLSAFAYLKDFAMPPRPGVHRNIVFENNTIDGSANCGIFAAGVEGLRIAGNTIRNACQSPTKPEGSAAMCIMNSSGVAAVNNRIDASKQGPGFREAVRNIGGGKSVTNQ